MKINNVKRRLQNDELVLCMAINQARTNDVPMMAAAAGFHALFVDMEHSAFSLETVSLLCTMAVGCGVTPLVRVASTDVPDIATLLDCGSQGLMLPHIKSAEHAKAVVGRCKYPPLGNRSLTHMGPHLQFRSYRDDEIMTHMNRETLLVGMLETPKAIEQLDEIVAVPGIDVVHIGSRDLCMEYGLPGDYRNPRMIEIYRRVAHAARFHGKAAGVGGIRGDREFQLETYKMGYRYMTIGSDVGYILAGAKADTTAITEAIATQSAE